MKIKTTLIILGLLGMLILTNALLRQITSKEKDLINTNSDAHQINVNKYNTKADPARVLDEVTHCNRNITREDILGIWRSPPTEGPTLQFHFKEGEVVVDHVEKSNFAASGVWSFDETGKYIKIDLRKGFEYWRVGRGFDPAIITKYPESYSTMRNIVSTSDNISFDVIVSTTKYSAYSKMCGLAFVIAGSIYDKVE